MTGSQSEVGIYRLPSGISMLPLSERGCRRVMRDIRPVTIMGLGGWHSFCNQ